MKFFMSMLISFLFVGISFAEPPKSNTDNNGNYWCHFDSVHGSDCNTCTDGQMSQGPFNRKPNCNKVCEATAEGTNCSSSSMVFKPGKGQTAQSVGDKTPTLSGKNKSKKTKKTKKIKKRLGKKAAKKKGK